MHEIPYAQFENTKLSLNDHLAIDRTILANQRTLLAYIRTGLAIGVVGATFLELFTGLSTTILAYTFISVGLTLVLLGAVQYRRMKRRLSHFSSVTS